MFSKSDFQKKWFKDSESLSSTHYINERALRARAGLMFLAPIVLLYTRMEHGDHNEVVANAISGAVQVREYDHILPILLTVFVIYEMLTAMSVKTAHFSLTSQAGAYLTKNQTPIYQAMKPKVFAWRIGFLLAVICLVSLVYSIMQSLTLYLLGICMLFMWLETACGICAGCYFHQLLVRTGILDESCELCATSTLTKK